MLQVLDSIAATLRESGLLDKLGLSFPEIAVVGQESTGKSSVLERVLGLPLFPRGEDIVTRMPVRLRLSHLPDSEALKAFCDAEKLRPDEAGFYVRASLVDAEGRVKVTRPFEGTCILRRAPFVDFGGCVRTPGLPLWCFLHRPPPRDPLKPQNRRPNLLAAVRGHGRHRPRRARGSRRAHPRRDEEAHAGWVSALFLRHLLVSCGATACESFLCRVWVVSIPIHPFSEFKYY